jgi:acyl-CoA reductase-like NAD-dependent aldehyde dehydrogenase
VDNPNIDAIVQRVLQQLQNSGISKTVAEGSGSDGLFDDMEAAILAAWTAQQALTEGGMEMRKTCIAAIRQMGVDHAVDIAQREMAETKMGKYDHKIIKMQAASTRTPGVEDLLTDAYSGDHGLTVNEMAPFGVIGAITPVTHPVPTLVNNAISMIAAGNSVVVNPHPNAMNVSGYGVQLINRAIVKAGGPANLVTAVSKPTMETGKILFNHPRIAILVITGGPGVVKAAMQASKRAICAGPGNPPVVVDETADIRKAAKSIMEGATFDNNILCIGEKEIIVVNSVADELIRELKSLGCYQLSAAQMDQLAEQAFENGGRGAEEPVVNRKLVGRDASVLARAIGLELAADTPMLFGETAWNHPWVLAEQMMPCLPLIRVPDVEAAIQMAQKVEHGFRHTAIMHSKNIANLTRMGKVMNCTLFVKNGPSTAGLGINGEGTFTHSIASPTGEGITTARTFTRMRRCTMVDYLRVI